MLEVQLDSHKEPTRNMKVGSGWGGLHAPHPAHLQTHASLPSNAPYSTFRAASVRCKAFEPAGCQTLMDGWGSGFSCRTCRVASARTPPWPSSWRSVSQCCLFCPPMLAIQHLSLCDPGVASAVLWPRRASSVTTAWYHSTCGCCGREERCAAAVAAVACAQALPP